LDASTSIAGIAAGCVVSVERMHMG
jgi:hypothetical protein